MLFPRITYAAVILDATLAARPLRPGLPIARAGGREDSAAGIPSGYVVRWEYPLTIEQRLTEVEWPSFRAWLVHAMLGGSFTWAKSPGSTAHTCYLVTPALTDGGELPSLDYPGDYELQYTIRRADGAAIDEVSF